MYQPMMCLVLKRTRHIIGLIHYRLATSSTEREICLRCAKILLAAEHNMQLAYYLQNTDWFQRCSEIGFFDELVIILFTFFLLISVKD